MAYSFGASHRIVKKYSECKRELFESWWVVGGWHLVENLFKNLKILPLISQYIFSIVMFVIKHKHQFTLNSEIHNINTRQHLNLHQPSPNLTGSIHGIHYSGVRIYNNLPFCIKQLSDDPRTFERKFKNVLCIHSFYSLEEYFQHQHKS